MQLAAAAALRNLSENNNDNQEYIARASDGDGVKALLVMAKSGSKIAQEEASGCLQNLATNNAIDPLVAMGAKEFDPDDDTNPNWGDADAEDADADLNPDVRPSKTDADPDADPYDDMNV